MDQIHQNKTTRWKTTASREQPRENWTKQQWTRSIGGTGHDFCKKHGLDIGLDEHKDLKFAVSLNVFENIYRDDLSK